MPIRVSMKPILFIVAVSVGCTIAPWGFASVDRASSFVSADLEIKTTDGRSLTYHVDRPDIDAPVPALIVIDGSGCGGARRDGFVQLMAPQDNPDLNFARVVVGKTGVPVDQPEGQACSQVFLDHYAMDDRLIDHLRVLQSIRNDASWWNGEFLVFGWSDGGDIAAQLFAYTPDVARASFGGVGGGYSMRAHFEDFWVCPEGQVEDHSGCLESLDVQFNAMLDNPTASESWSGDDNSYKAWASRLNTILSPILVDEERPFLVVHGAEDFDGAPVESARRLAQDIDVSSRANAIYWEVEGMAHGIWSLPPDRALELETAVLRWLAGDLDGPPNGVRQP